MSKILYFDVETTGKSSKAHSIIQLAGIVEIDGNVVEEFEYKICPDNYDNISEEAIAIHGMTIDEMKGFTPPELAHSFFKKTLLNKYCNPYDKGDKFIPAGFNVQFDLKFLTEFFVRRGDKYLGSYLDWRKTLDPLHVIRAMDFNGLISLENYKLETICKEFGIDIKAHDALSDIRATRKVLKEVLKYVKR